MRTFKLNVHLSFLAFCAMITNTASTQTEDWLHQFDPVSFGYLILPYDNGDHLVVGTTKNEIFLSRRTTDNEEIWHTTYIALDSIWPFRPLSFPYAEILDNEDILMVDYFGNVLKSSPMNQHEIKLITNLKDAITDEFENLQIQNVTSIDNHFCIQGTGVQTHVRKNFYAIFNPTNHSLIHYKHLSDDLGFYFTNFESISFDKYIYAPFRPNPYIVQCLDTQNIIIWSYSDSIDNLRIYNVHVATDTTTYLLGTSNVSSTVRGTQGEVISISNDGKFNWRLEIPPSNPIPNATNLISILNIAELADGNLFITGSTGRQAIGPIRDLFMAKISKQGEILWQETKKLSHEGDESSNLLVQNGSVLILGIANRSDAIGVGEQAFVLKLDGLSSTTDVNSIDVTTLFPNPSHDYIKLQSNKYHGSHYLILNNTGKLVDQGVVNDQPIDVTKLASSQYHLIIEYNNTFDYISFMKL